MKYTTTVTISRRGTSDVIENMLLNTATSTKIGTALSAIASGVSKSLSRLNRISRNDIAIPSSVPAKSPTKALVPDTIVASQMSSKLEVNWSQIADGGGRKYGLRSKTSTAPSQSARKPTPNTSGGHTA